MRAFISQLVVSLTAMVCVAPLAAQSTTPSALQSSEDQVSTLQALPQSAGQPSPSAGPEQQPQISAAMVATATTDSPAVQILQNFKDSDIKFNLPSLMDILRDKRHEGWVLAAYPDPKTGHPLIGAGFTLDLPQPDSLNPHFFLEPSSDDLWRAAGLDHNRLDAILDQYDTRFAQWKKKGFRRRIPTLAAQITNEDAEQLLRISAIQSIYNARAYCRNFDRMTGPQQMAVSQLVYQIGVNLARFDDLLSQLNEGAPATTLAADAPAEALLADRQYWQSMQHTLIQTQWARHYRTRAIAVIAMLDPAYDENPAAAEHLVGASLRPAVMHRRHRSSASLDQVSEKTRTSHSGQKKRAHSRSKRKA